MPPVHLGDSMALVLSDSGVYPTHDAYERQILASTKNGEFPARVRIKVARQKIDSHAAVDLWTMAGWAELIRWSTTKFWSDMTGYTRVNSENADTQTRELAADLLDELDSALSGAEFN